MNIKIISITGTLLLTASAAIAPFFIGDHVQQQLQLQVENFKQRIGEPYWMDVTLEDYQKKYSSATARTVITINLNKLQQEENELPPIKLVINHVIHHGPVIISPSLSLGMANIESKLVVPDEYQEIAQHYFSEQSPFSQLTHVSLMGNANMAFNIPAYQGLDHTGEANIDWQGMSGNAKGNLIDASGTMQITAPKLQITKDDNLVSFEKMTANGDTHLSPNGLALGKVQFTIDKFDVNDRQAESPRQTQVEKVDVVINSTLSGELVNIDQDITVGAIRSSDNEVGPVNMEIKMNNFHEPTLVKLQNNFNQLQSNLSVAEDLQQQLVEQLIDSLPELLSYSPNIEFNKLQITTPQGVVDGRVLAAFDGSGDFDMSMGLFALIPRITAELDLSMPESMVREISRKQAGQRLNMMLVASEQEVTDDEYQQLLEQATDRQMVMMEQANFMTKVGDKHKTSMRFFNSQLTINGEPADQIMGLLAGQ